MTDTDAVTLMDPPSLGRLDWASIARQVREHPGQWCRVPRSFNPTVAMHIRRGNYPHVQPSEFEVTTRKDYDEVNKSWIFLRTRP
jgi:hypothetical protein